MKYFAILTLFFVITFVSCSNYEQLSSPNIKTESAQISSQEEKEDISTVSKTEGCSDLIWVDQSQNNSVCVTFRNYDKLKAEENDFLKTFVENWLEEYTGQEFVLQIGIKQEKFDRPEGYYIELNGETTFHSEEFVSVIFQGMISARSAAHPNHVFFSVNYNSQTLTEIPFSSEHVADEALYEAFACEAKRRLLDEIGKSSLEDFDVFSVICSAEQFKLGLREQCPIDQRIYYYKTSQGLGFSYSVVFALGGHKEVVLPLSALTTQKTSDSSVS